MEHEKQKASKRLDLQGIRGLAIAAVLLYHFYPKQFPYGCLGVDQFFVLSGFLMCLLLKRAENESPYSLITLFYYRRFKRLLPLYLLVILLSLLFFYNFFPITTTETNRSSAVRALLFVSNWPNPVKLAYNAMNERTGDIFAHTWSLSVEIQFYFLVPVIFLIGKVMPTRFQILYFAIIGTISYSYFLISPRLIAKNSVFARIWQFVAGMLVYLCTLLKNDHMSCKNNQEEFEKLLDTKMVEENKAAKPKPTSTTISKIFSYFFLFCFLYITFFACHLGSWVKPMITVVTGCLMMVSEDNEFLSNKFLAYLGDISYSLYLIHWSIEQYWWFTTHGDPNYKIQAILVSICLAIIVFETFEKWYLKISSTSLGILILALFVLNVLLIEKDQVFELIGGDSYDAQQANYKWNTHTVQNLYSPTCNYESKDSPFGWCRHTMQKFVNNVKHKMFILNALPEINRSIVMKIAPMLKNGTDPVVIDKMLINATSNSLSRKRYAQLEKDCGGKCELVDYKSVFYNISTGTYRFFDTNGFSYLSVFSQLTPLGLDRVRHIWTGICNSL
ncbi:Acyltransferase 3 domain-containing protein [Caenorhabditis elegans]|uniref:Acyltransferase 3 domain-containing protein n=1 Tax=Caenorhabditis elegans TaxID=6239 RepID=K8FDX6_CAEEL|nr:Acyltransferase 3 domain-containing protein [Caenorhabditis elegans]CCO25599.1 Acyltransferase 3 domain-containing protein [Caenorhabditis elegans]|eukprot:NP_001263901.1 O-ACyltransferase homolog [Caenorhabditis elegans]